MSVTPKTYVPTEIIQGQSVIFDLSYNDFPVTESWTMIFQASGQPGSLVATGSVVGSSWEFSIPYAVIATLDTGSMAYLVSATDQNSNRYIAESGQIEILPNPLTVAADARTYARKMLDAIELVLMGEASRVDQSLSIAGRSITKYARTELLRFRAQFRAEVENEQDGERIARGLGTSRKILVRFKNSN